MDHRGDRVRTTDSGEQPRRRGDLRFTVTYTLRPEDDGTRYTYRVEAESCLGGIFGRLADPIVEKAQRRTVRANVDTLAELLGHSQA